MIPLFVLSMGPDKAHPRGGGSLPLASSLKVRRLPLAWQMANAVQHVGAMAAYTALSTFAVRGTLGGPGGFQNV